MLLFSLGLFLPETRRTLLPHRRTTALTLRIAPGFTPVTNQRARVPEIPSQEPISSQMLSEKRILPYFNGCVLLSRTI